MIKLGPKLRKLFKTDGELPAEKALPPLFITGCMRSGTTFLSNKLTGHPQLLKIGWELIDVWTKIGGASCFNTCPALDEKDVNPVYTYNMSMYFKSFIDESKTLKRLLMRANAYYFRGTDRVDYDWDNIIPVNKSPHLVNKIKYVKGLFPDAHFVFIIRDIYAQSASLKAFMAKSTKETGRVQLAPNDGKSCWTTILKKDLEEGVSYLPKDFELIPMMWMRLNLHGLRAMAEIPAEQRTVLKYEDLLNDQQGTLGKVFQSLKLLQKHKKEEKRLLEKKISYKNTATKGDSREKWKTTLTDDEKNTIENIIKRHQKDYDEINTLLNSMKV